MGRTEGRGGREGGRRERVGRRRGSGPSDKHFFRKAHHTDRRYSTCSLNKAEGYFGPLSRFSST